MCTKKSILFCTEKSVCKKENQIPLFDVDHIGMKSFLKDLSYFPTPSFSLNINETKTSRDK